MQYHIRALHSGKCLDVRGGSQNDGAIIQQYRCNGTAAQTWVLHGVTGGFEIRALNSGKCVDVKGASKADYAAVVQYRCGLGAPNRTFRLQPGMFDQVFQIQAVHSNKCLDVKGASQQDGAPVVQYECNPAATDRNWVFERV
ncbi:RICIN domain-containing protein [Streptomyces sp. NPDC004838]